MENKEKELKDIIKSLMDEKDNLQNKVNELEVGLKIANENYEDKSKILLDLISNVEQYEKVLKEQIEAYKEVKDEYLTLNSKLKKDIKQLNNDKQKLLDFIKGS